MAHLVETMAFTGQTPWHGLGNQLTPNPSKFGHNKQVWIGVLNPQMSVTWRKPTRTKHHLTL
jgi:hypothetical protein